MKCSDEYPRKALYLAVTLPMIFLYAVLFLWLWSVQPAYAFLYAALFIIVAAAQSYACTYWQCPYVGKFGPCAGGFCLPAGRIALLWRKAGRSAGVYAIAVTVGFAAFFAIILYPAYFIALRSAGFLLGYLAIVGAYLVWFVWGICPECATRPACPIGKIAMHILGMLGGPRSAFRLRKTGGSGVSRVDGRPGGPRMEVVIKKFSRSREACGDDQNV